MLSPVGLNMRSTPSADATRVATVPRGAELIVEDSRVVAGRTWFKVRDRSQVPVEGFVLRDRDLVIERPVTTHYDPAGYSLLYPQEWSVDLAGDVTVLKPASGYDRLSIQAGSDPAKLMAVPTAPGHAVREEGPVEVYGRTVFITVYRLDSGLYEFDVRFKLADQDRAFLFLGSASRDDTGLYRQLLASVIISS